VQFNMLSSAEPISRRLVILRIGAQRIEVALVAIELSPNEHE